MEVRHAGLDPASMNTAFREKYAGVGVHGMTGG
jgi:hypothetical protein